MTKLKTQVELNEALAHWLGVESVALVREDLLPHGGGKKRRALERFTREIGDKTDLHVLSYAGSHTAYTLSKLLPDVTIHLYGTHYGGGPYEKAMVALVNQSENVIQTIGSTLTMTLAYNHAKKNPKPGHHFMRIGGSLGADTITVDAVKNVKATLGEAYHHYAAVASGDLLSAISSQTDRVTGVLTQPFFIRVLKKLSLANSTGVNRTSLSRRIALMREVRVLTGNLWDPIFMGNVFAHLKSQKSLSLNICIWVTCPAGIEW